MSNSSVCYRGLSGHWARALVAIVLASGIPDAVGEGAPGSGSSVGTASNSGPSVLRIGDVAGGYFGDVSIGASQDVAATYGNLSQTENISGISIAVSGATFSITSNACPLTLVPGSECSFTISFKPTAGLVYQGELVVTSSVAGSPEQRSLWGKGIDSTPDPFTFIGTSGVPRGGLIASDSVVIRGINVAAAVSISNGEYSIGCGNTFTAAEGTISNVGTVCVRHNSSPYYGSSVTTTLTVGGVSGNFTSITEPQPTSPPSAAFRKSPNDFNGDGRSDILLKHADGSIYLWLMNGVSVDGGAYLQGAGSGWTVAGAGDFNGDAKNDIVLKHIDDSIYILLMNGNAAIGGGFFEGAGSGWRFSHAGDFNGDGKSDIIMTHTDGSIYLRSMDGLAIVGGASLQGAGTGWTVSHVGDVNGDGKSDIVWTHTEGSVALWTMDGLSATANALLTSAGTGWSIAGVGDLDGDGKSDILWKHAEGQVVAWLMDGVTRSADAFLVGGSSGMSVALIADLDGNGKADIVWNHADGSVSGWLMNGLAVAATANLVGPGSGWSVTHARDLDGNGKADLLWTNAEGAVVAWLMNGLSATASATLVGSGQGWSIDPPR